MKDRGDTNERYYALVAERDKNLARNRTIAKELRAIRARRRRYMSNEPELPTSPFDSLLTELPEPTRNAQLSSGPRVTVPEPITSLDDLIEEEDTSNDGKPWPWDIPEEPEA